MHILPPRRAQIAPRESVAAELDLTAIEHLTLGRDRLDHGEIGVALAAGTGRQVAARFILAGAARRFDDLGLTRQLTGETGDRITGLEAGAAFTG